MASRDVSPLRNPCGLRVTLSRVGGWGGWGGGEEPVNLTVKSGFAELTKASTEQEPAREVEGAGE